MSEEFFRFPVARSRISTGQIKSIIRDSKDEYLRSQLIEILCDMISKKVGWVYLTWRYSDMDSGSGKDE